MILLSFNITNNEKKFKNNFYIDDEKILEITVFNTEAILRILEHTIFWLVFSLKFHWQKKRNF